ncbi:MAG: hypothetical protein GXO66_04290 [Euryarchaeota archaeon]|nr:hypothetical protein [Euryarchaeota archaeon]
MKVELELLDAAREKVEKLTREVQRYDIADGVIYLMYEDRVEVFPLDRLHRMLVMKGDEGEATL